MGSKHSQENKVSLEDKLIKALRDDRKKHEQEEAIKKQKDYDDYNRTINQAMGGHGLSLGKPTYGFNLSKRKSSKRKVSKRKV